ncbi:hypothetical protein CHLNCDRAFT_133407 [Chlorella variabilis]|uniref:Uncharacterized protein n=1 Tax=Chlorella variabilis TaxID=554065 RepID=E1Z314_CHLVA|nr:hypothetical protein CHLNCDRAFT_133407 [Chlorella variabilis]EFN60092.1 hypothetical protein CHLNCDRAFT_133407 [Chlorella variabilis]|eukprot:XP_005852194.1 hypothetical protein CHLNCDRAFT_133407 [Chlorella variabilis]
MSFEPILILYAFLAVVQLILTMLPGVWYTRKGTVNVEMRRALSGMAFNLLLPAVVFINIAGQVTADTIVSYWPFAMNTCVSTLVGMGLGWVVNEVVGTPRHLRYHVVAACGYGNLNRRVPAGGGLPLMITTAVCDQEKMPFYQALGSECVTVGWGYVAVSSAVVQIFGYPMAKWLLRRRVAPRSFVEVLRDISTISLKGMPRPPSMKEGEVGQAVELAAAGAAPARPHKAASAPHGYPRGQPAAVAAAAAAAQAGELPEAVEEDKALNGAEAGGGAAAREGSGGGGGKGGGAGSGADSDTDDEAAAAGVCLLAAMAACWLLAAAMAVRYVVQGPTVAAVISLIIGCITPLRELFFPVTSAALGFVTGAITSLQSAYVFIASFILGSVMARGPGPGTKTMGLKACLCTVGVRFIILPVVGCLIVIGSIKAGWYMPANPYATPTANQIQNMASMFQNHEKEIGAVIFWEYIIAMLAIPAWMVMFLFLMDRFDLYEGA